MISRRRLLATGAGAGAILSCPAIAGARSADLLVVDPALLSGAPPLFAVAASGHALLEALLPRVDAIRRLEGYVGAGDALMLAELVRFLPGMRWTTAQAAAGSLTPAGRLRRPALAVAAVRG